MITWRATAEQLARGSTFLPIAPLTAFVCKGGRVDRVIACVVKRIFFAIVPAILIAGCAGGSTAVVTPATTMARPPWYRQAPAALRKGVYIAEYFTSEILGYAWATRKNIPPVCAIPGTYVVDVATDKSGNLIDPDGGGRTVTVFRGPQMCGPKIGSFTDNDGQPSDAATSDATAGTIYVANIQATGKPYGNVSVCTLAGGCSAVLSSHAIGGELFSVAEDAQGNVYSSGYPQASGSGPGSGASLVLWKNGKGKGVRIAAYRNSTPGGLEVDAKNELLALDTFAPALWVYTGCPAKCTAHGPFALKGETVFGKLDAKLGTFEAADVEYGQVDVYRYAGTKGVTYLYSYSNGLTPSGDVEGIAIDPAAAN